uniref:Uncharacterized protein n=1 Tax=Ananas comosus var. bracteatus TaxID=296719 RepID=A0A6V7QKI8_ANACO|nr:unnamed protein product [Ananas comosus var. bracteatus]
MALTAGAATALRGAATLRARLHREIQGIAALIGERRIREILITLSFRVVIDVCSEIPAWPGRELEDGCDQRAYFGIKTPERFDRVRVQKQIRQTVVGRRRKTDAEPQCQYDITSLM